MQDQIFTFETLLRRMQLDDGERPFVIWREKDLFGTHAYPVKIDVPCWKNRSMLLHQTS